MIKKKENVLEQRGRDRVAQELFVELEREKLGLPPSHKSKIGIGSHTKVIEAISPQIYRSI